MKNIVFDLGGVVVDWNPGRLIREYPGDPEMPVALFEKGFFERFWPDYDRGRVSQTDIVKEISRFTGRCYAESWDFVEFIKHSLRDLPVTQRFIKELSERGYRLFCLSNMSVEFYDYLKDREVFSYFEGQIISALEHVIKPEKEIYEVLMNRYDVVPEEAVFIDDLEQNIEAARQLGFHTVHFADKEKGMREIKGMLSL
ncbi:MAG: HAD family phosphatase [Odoribacter sp.]|nr:HAD family phosphatase [Odoribacter sp.]